MADTARRPSGRWSLPNRLEGRALAVARAAWLTTITVLAVLVTAGFVQAFGDPSLIAQEPLTDVFDVLGLGYRTMMALALVLPIATTLVVSAIVFTKRSDDPMALLLTISLVLLFSYSCRSLLPFDGTWLQPALPAVFALAMLALILVLGLFPTGGFVPPSARWLVVAMTFLLVAFPDAGRLLMDSVDTARDGDRRTAAAMAGWVLLIAAGSAAQVRRYRRVSSASERAQTKWVVFPLLVALTMFVVLLPLAYLLPGSADLLLGWGIFAIIPLGILMPLMFANAVLRHRLYEIDRVISRTASYALLTVLLAGLYAAGVVGLGWLGRAVAGGASSELVVAASTLAVVGAFGPLRRRLQDAVDRSFYRSRYDAARTVERFGQQLRHDGDLDALARDLRRVVSGTVHPRATALWLLEEPAAPEQEGLLL